MASPNRYNQTSSTSRNSDTPFFFPTLSSRQRRSNESPNSHPLSFRERIIDQQRRLFSDDIGHDGSDIGESWVDEMLSQQLLSEQLLGEWPAHQEPSIQRAPSFDAFHDDGADPYDFAADQRRTRSHREHTPNSVTPPGIRYSRQHAQQQLPTTPPSQYSNTEPSRSFSPYFSDEEAATEPPSPSSFLAQALYSRFQPGQKITFLSLPLELRQEIYNLILGFEDQVRIHDISDRNKSAPVQSWLESPKAALLCICKQVHEEASDVLYTNAQFTMDLSEADHEDGFKKLSLGVRKKIRKLQVLVFPRSAYPMPVWFEPELWEPVLTDLTSLTIVAQEPFNAENPDVELSWKEAEQWRRWAGPIFKYFDKQLAVGVVLEIDDNSRNVTKKLVEKSFKKHEAKRVETMSGDWLFIRGKVKEWHEDDDQCCVM